MRWNVLLSLAWIVCAIIACGVGEYELAQAFALIAIAAAVISLHEK